MADSSGRSSYWLTRFVILRLLGLVYFVAFLCLARQAIPLIGEHGLLPAQVFLDRVETQAGSPFGAFLLRPSFFFWTGASDATLSVAAWTGVGLSLLVLAGFANAVLMAVLWALYLSFVHIGQDWYGYGWEIQLLETGSLAILLCPLLDARPFPRRPPPVAVIWLFRWLLFRIMLGAGLIKMRGDPCWRDLTCLYYHYETQPIPNPLSRTLHFMPPWFHRLGVIYNHLCELVAPWFAFGPALARRAAGCFMLVFQVILILSGNLSFLNWLTIVPILACFDDAFLAPLLPRRLVARSQRAAEEARPSSLQAAAALALVLLVAVLSVQPVLNLVSGHQIMNTSFNRLDLVNTYGAFGSVGKERLQLVFEGTDARSPEAADAAESGKSATVDEGAGAVGRAGAGESAGADESAGAVGGGGGAGWREYPFKCQPGDPVRRPCIVSPYHERIDWQIWFAAMSTPNRYPWTLHFVWKLLHNNAATLGLLAGNPFPNAPPRFVRARLYRYEFARPGEARGLWWKRTLLRDWLPPLSADDPRLRQFLDAYGWLDEPDEGQVPPARVPH